MAVAEAARVVEVAVVREEARWAMRTARQAMP